MPKGIFTDKVRVEQVLKNLLSNAFKFTPDGGTITVEAVQGEEEKTISFKIKDNGIGIEPEYHDTIFGLFKRLQKRDELSGSGIGLATCRKIIESYGGRIWVESRPGNGSTFFFSLPPD